MTKLSTPLLREFLSIIASRPNIKNAANVIGVTDITVHNWIKRSRNSDPLLLVDWPEGEEPRQFAEHMITARRMSLLQFESQVRDEVLNGRKRILRNASTGSIVYETDERFIGVSDDDMKLCGYDPPAYYRVRRNPDGSPVPGVVYDPPPAHLTIAVLTKAVNGYADTKHVSIDHAVHGVVHVGGPQVASKQIAPPVLEAALAEDVAADDVAADDVDADLMDENDSAVAFEAEASLVDEPTNGRRVDPGPADDRPDIVALRRLAALPPAERRAAFSARSPREAQRLWEPAEGVGEGDVAPGGYQPSGPSPRYPRR